MGKLKPTLMLLSLLLLATVFAVPMQTRVYATSSGDDWPMFQYDPAHTGYTTSAGPTTTPQVLWSANNLGQASYPDFSFQAVVDGIVYVSTGKLYALNESTGEELWSKDGTCAFAVYDGYVYAGPSGCTAYNASTGAIVWNASSAGGTGSAIAVADGFVYDTEYPEGNFLVARNASTGAEIWNYTTSGPFSATEINSAPAIAGDVVYILAGSDGNLYAFSAYTGAKLWNLQIQPAAEKQSPYVPSFSPVIANGKIYIGNYTSYQVKFYTSFLALGVASNTTTSPNPSSTIPEFPSQFLATTLLVSLVLVVSVIAVKKTADSKVSSED